MDEVKVKIVAELDRPSWQAAAQKAANEFKGATATQTGQTGLTAAANSFNRRDISARRDAIMDQEKLMKAQKKHMKDQVTFLKDMSFLMMPAFNPGSVWATLFATRQTFSAMNTERGQSMLKGFGLKGVGGAAIGTAALVGGATVVGAALLGFKKAIEGSKGAIEKAFGIYTGAAQAGLSTNFYQSRNSSASILGIQGNPNQVFQFGAALKYVTDRTREANKVLSNTAKPLATVAIDARILMNNLSALSASIANGFAPAIDALVNKLSEWTLTAMRHSKDIGNVILAMSGLGGAALAAYQATHKGSGLGSKLPAMIPNMKQLPASAWEHMGLVIGGGGLNYQRVIATNSTKQVNLLGVIARALFQTGHLGMNPNVSHQ